MYKIYTRNNIADSIAVSRKLANAGKRDQAGSSDILIGAEIDPNSIPRSG